MVVAQTTRGGIMKHLFKVLARIMPFDRAKARKSFQVTESGSSHEQLDAPSPEPSAELPPG